MTTLPRAVVTFLWEKHLEALRTYLPDAGIDVIVTSALHARPLLHEIAAEAGCELVIFDAGVRADTSARADATTAALHEHVTAATWLPDLDEETREALRPLFHELIDEEIPDAVRVLDCLRTVHENHDIALYVASEDVTSVSKLTAAWARAHRVPSLHLAHSLALVDPYTVHRDLTADVLAVYGERGAEGYLDLGIDPDRIVVTGNPAWDGYAQLVGRATELRRQLTTRHGLDPALPLVVFGTTWGGHQTALELSGPHTRTLGWFIEACEQLFAAGLRFQPVVKDRPSNADFGEDFLRTQLQRYGADPARYLYTTEDTQEWAVAADLLVAVQSNYLVEAMIVGTPGINLVGATAPMPPVFEAGCGIAEARPDELADRIRELLEDESIRARRRAEAAERAEYHHHGVADGRSAQRAAALMRALARPPRHGSAATPTPGPAPETPATTSRTGVAQRLAEAVRGLSRRRR